MNLSARCKHYRLRQPLFRRSSHFYKYELPTGFCRSLLLENLKAHGLMSDSLIMQRDTTDLTAENRELKLRLQAMEQQAQLRDGMCSTIH
ncbi:hypothetical protein BHE74_00019699 [Ensete ventricosum]|uniref:Uncharacterized protein n=1 Tax=Ensete ventricosum TaxID=4639 RepID=A0A427AUL3_ENSVE|nr:hypothetical protein B296_00002675 [Ensete ventricosum]RWW72500.1 hypothetical protein BHE74_00019699 [Ensete ventricosum]RZR83838.1 hypothetical protein BHM03_00010556 [Ensete ventricosum]